jgi:hypothetical protein
VIAACRLAVKEMLDADDLRIEQEGLEEKLLLLNERIRRLVNDNARPELDQEEYWREYDALSAEYKQAAERIQEIDEECNGPASTDHKRLAELFEERNRIEAKLLEHYEFLMEIGEEV